MTKAGEDRVGTARTDQCFYSTVRPLCVEGCGNPGAVKVRIVTEFLGNCISEMSQGFSGSFSTRPVCYKKKWSRGKIF